MGAVSVKDVAAFAGVSLGTVSNALNRPGQVSPATLAKVSEAIEALGYVRNDAARQLRAGSSRSIGLIVLDATNPFFTAVAAGAEDRAAHYGVSVLVANSNGSAVREIAHIALFEEQRVRGVLITPVGELPPQAARLRGRGIPTVVVDRAVDDPGVPSVSVDDVAGGRLAVEHLLSLGRRRIAFVGGPLGIRQVSDRLQGASRATDLLPEARLEVLATRALTVVEGRRVGEALVARPRASRPDAVFAANDLLAVGLLQGLAHLGSVHVPRDIALIGYDDIDFAAASVVPLSSIRQPSEQIGRTAVDLLLSEEESAAVARQVVFEPQLVPRASTLDARPASEPPTSARPRIPVTL